MMGKVYLVGAGTGDEELITLKAMKLIKIADVIIFDRLINENLLNYAREECELINVGKASNNHTLPQDKINELLAIKAKEGNLVVRLKGGDPFVYGRGGEEGIFLKDKDVYFEVVPGISSLSAVTSYAGIPITHRGVSNEVHVFTGHEKDDKDNLNIDFSIISKLKGTLIFYMGLSNVKMISEELIKGGMDKNTPMALISKGTYGDQKTAIGTLENICERLAGIESPALIVVGEVIRLREKLNWFENKPLHGSKILITRHKDKNRSLRGKLEEKGARVYLINTIDFEEIEDKTLLKNTFDNISKYNYLVFNSANGVDYFIKEFIKYRKDLRLLGNIKLIAMGEVTKNKIEEFYLSAEIVYDGSSSAGFIELLQNKISKDEKLIIVTSDISDKEKYKELNNSCKEVNVLDAYKTVSLNIPDAEIIKISQADIITFHSPSAVRSFFEFLDKNENNVNMENKTFVVVGTTTKFELEKRNIKNIHVANIHNDEGVIETILNI